MVLVRVMDVDLQRVFKAEEGADSKTVSTKPKARRNTDRNSNIAETGAETGVGVGVGTITDESTQPPSSPSLPHPQYVFTCSIEETVDVRAIEGHLVRIVSAR